MKKTVKTCAFCCLVLACQTGANSSVALDNTVDIQPIHDTAAIVSVSTRLEGRGSIIMSSEEETGSRMNLDARLQYDERLLSATPKLKTIRNYQAARAEIRIGDGSVVNELASQNRLVICQFENDQRINLASVRHSLSQNEFDLLSTPASTLIAAEFFAQKDVSTGSNWSPADAMLAHFLNIDYVTDNQVELSLAGYEKGLATIQINGHAQGSIDGAATDLRLQGTAIFDCDQGRLNTIRLTINQQRKVGLLAPGLEAQFKLETVIRPARSATELANDSLTALRASKPKITDLLRLDAKSGDFWLIHSRDWRVVGNGADRTVLRLVEDDQPIGQVDIISLPPLNEERTQTLESFKQSIRNRLGKETSIVSANQSRTESGLSTMRVVAKGKVQEIPLTWIYYVVSHDDGRRLQLIFTTEPHQTGEFGNADQDIVNDITFTSSD